MLRVKILSVKILNVEALNVKIWLLGHKNAWGLKDWGKRVSDTELPYVLKWQLLKCYVKSIRRRSIKHWGLKYQLFKFQVLSV